MEATHGSVEVAEPAEAVEAAEANVEMYPLVGGDGKVVGIAARTLKALLGGTKLIPCPGPETESETETESE